MNEVSMKYSKELIRPKFGDIFKIEGDYFMLINGGYARKFLDLETGECYHEFQYSGGALPTPDIGDISRALTGFEWEYIGGCKIELRKLED